MTLAVIVTAYAEAKAQMERPPWDNGSWIPPVPWSPYPPPRPPPPPEEQPPCPADDPYCNECPPDVECIDTRQIVCTLWRDFYRIEGTNKFVRWKGGPYKVCKRMEDWWNVSWEETGQPRYEHGRSFSVPNTRKNRCTHCKSVAAVCQERARRGTQLCQEASGAHWRDQCRTTWRDRKGRRPSMQCPTPIPGIPTRLCEMWIEECVEGYASSHPGESLATGGAVKADGIIFGIEGNVTYEIQAGGRAGYRDSCARVGEQAYQLCAAKQADCEFDYAGGGCE